MTSQRRFKIVHTDTDDIENPLRGGQPVRTYSINSRLTERHDITVFTSVYPGSVRQVGRRGINYRRLGFRLPPFGLSPHLSFLASLGMAVRRTPHDLVVEEFTPPVGFCGLPSWTKKPVVLVVQWYFFEQWEKRYHLPFGKWMRRIAANGAYRHVIVQSHAMRREIEKVLPAADIRRIPCGIDDSAFIEGAPAETGRYVLFIGRLDLEHKGLDLLMDAWRKVCAPAGIPLVIAGEGPARVSLEETIARERWSGLVTLIGRVEGESKRAALAGSRLVAMPSRYETFGITGLEAMAAGRPLVCFDIDHLNELARAPWAECIPKFDAAAFGRAVSEIWGHPERCRLMGAAACLQAREYHWDVIARQQEQFYLEVLSKHRETT